MAIDEGALICDLAETYGILSYESLPVRLVATLSAGLRDNSRIKMKLSDAKADNTTWMLASAADCLSLLVWQNTENGQKGVKRPALFTELLLGNQSKQKDFAVFDTPEEYEAARKKFKGGDEECQQ